MARTIMCFDDDDRFRRNLKTRLEHESSLVTGPKYEWVPGDLRPDTFGQRAIGRAARQHLPQRWWSRPNSRLVLVMDIAADNQGILAEGFRMLVQLRKQLGPRRPPLRLFTIAMVVFVTSKNIPLGDNYVKDNLKNVMPEVLDWGTLKGIPLVDSPRRGAVSPERKVAEWKNSVERQPTVFWSNKVSGHAINNAMVSSVLEYIR